MAMTGADADDDAVAECSSRSSYLRKLRHSASQMNCKTAEREQEAEEEEEWESQNR